MFRFKAVGTVFKALKMEHLTPPSPNLHIRSHTVSTVCPNVCRCVNLLLHVYATLSNYIGQKTFLNGLKEHENFINSGRPPFPLVAHLNKDEVEYLTQYLDNFQAGVSSDGVGDLGEILGFLKEFREQEDNGKTGFWRPKV